MEDYAYQLSLKTLDGQIMINVRAGSAIEFDSRIVEAKQLFHKHFDLPPAPTTSPVDKSPAAKAKEFLDQAEKDSKKFSEHTEAAHEKKTPEDVTVKCQFCGGPMDDNQGKSKNPKAPHYKCRDALKKGCYGAAWWRGGQLSWSNKPPTFKK
jgi:hypothetical protein